MYARIIRGSVVAVLTSLLVAIALSSPTAVLQGESNSPALQLEVHPILAEGGAPVPPYPKLTMFKDQNISVIADGGAPVPPYPHKVIESAFAAA